MNEETCSYWPEEIIKRYDDDDIEHVRYDLLSDDWDCDKCGFTLSGSYEGWFCIENGNCYATYCPNCGRKIVQDLEKLQSEWMVEDD